MDIFYYADNVALGVLIISMMIFLVRARRGGARGRKFAVVGLFFRRIYHYFAFVSHCRESVADHPADADLARHKTGLRFQVLLSDPVRRGNARAGSGNNKSGEKICSGRNRRAKDAYPPDAHHARIVRAADPDSDFRIGFNDHRSAESGVCRARAEKNRGFFRRKLSSAVFCRAARSIRNFLDLPGRAHPKVLEKRRRRW